MQAANTAITRMGAEIVRLRKQLKDTEPTAAVVWYVSAAGVKRGGPYPDELSAWNAVKGLDDCPVAGAMVWPEKNQ